MDSKSNLFHFFATTSYIRTSFINFFPLASSEEDADLFPNLVIITGSIDNHHFLNVRRNDLKMETWMEDGDIVMDLFLRP